MRGETCFPLATTVQYASIPRWNRIFPSPNLFPIAPYFVWRRRSFVIGRERHAHIKPVCNLKSQLHLGVAFRQWTRFFPPIIIFCMRDKCRIWDTHPCRYIHTYIHVYMDLLHVSILFIHAQVFPTGMLNWIFWIEI